MEHAHVNDWLIGWISANYLIFSVQLLLQTRWSFVRTRSCVAIYALIATFVLCAFAGYISTLFDEPWSDVRLYLHIALAVVGTALWLSNQALVIARMLEQ